jgi:hypothetical protein
VQHNGDATYAATLVARGAGGRAVVVLAQQDGEEATMDLRERALPRPEPRRRRLSGRRCGNHWYGLEADRVT